MPKPPVNQLICSDCIPVMDTWEDNTVDTFATDPPYGLEYMELDWDKTLPPLEAFTQMHRVLKPGGIAFVMCSPRQDLLARMVLLLEKVGFVTTQSFISWIYKTGFPKAMDIRKELEKKASPMLPLFNESFPVAERYNGWKSITGLKPALEPVLMVHKPLSEPTIAENVMEWGTGAINVGDCLIPLSGEEALEDNNWYRKDLYESARNSAFQGKAHAVRRDPGEGRFPANLIVSDQALSDGTITKSGKIEPHHHLGPFNRVAYGHYDREPTEIEAKHTYGDEGDSWRYFDLDLWADAHGIVEDVAYWNRKVWVETYGFLDVPKPTTKEKEYGVYKGPKKKPKSKLNLSGGRKARLDGAKTTPRRNVHPTVKPVKLMAWLLRLGTPPGGLAVDPFGGTYTTCVAAKQLGINYVGIEIKKKWHKIGVQRVNAIPIKLTEYAVNE